MDYLREMERIEAVKARERQVAQLKQNTVGVNRPTRENQSQKGRVNDIVAKAVDYSFALVGGTFDI